jgi:tetratricopeptide (TPR) repeat protein
LRAVVDGRNYVKIAVIRRYVPAGARLTIHLRTGETVAGRVVAYEDDDCVLVAADGHESLISDAMIEKVDFALPATPREQQTAEPVNTGPQTVPAPAPEAANTSDTEARSEESSASAEVQAVPAIRPADEAPGLVTPEAAASSMPEALQGTASPAAEEQAPAAINTPPETQVDAQSDAIQPHGENSRDWLTEMRTVHASLVRAIASAAVAPRPPDFHSVPDLRNRCDDDAARDIQRRWDQERNRYQYAVKIREFQRLGQCVSGLRALVRHYPWLAEAHALLGSLFHELDNTASSGEALSQAVSRGYPAAMRDLAGYHLLVGDADPARRTLAAFLLHSIHDSDPEAWRTLVRLAVQGQVPGILLDIVNEALLADDIGAIADEIINGVIYVVIELQLPLLDDVRSLVNRDEDAGIRLSAAAAALEGQRSEPAEPVLVPPGTGRRRTAPRAATAVFAQAKPTPVAPLNVREANNYLLRAEAFAQEKKLGEALYWLRKARQLDPDNRRAERLEREWADRSSRSGLPKGNTPFARAERARQFSHDYVTAEKFYREAIQSGDQAENAVKSLAALLHQLQRSDDALKTIRDYESQNSVSNQTALDNIYSEIAAHAGKTDEAIDRIRAMLSRSNANKAATARLLYNLAAVYARERRFDMAVKELEKCLRVAPEDERAQRMLDVVRSAQFTDVYGEVDQLIKESFASIRSQEEFGPVLALDLDRCDYDFVDVEKKTTRQFSLEDVEALEKRSEKARGEHRARERANARLSAARILLDLNSDDKERLRSNLRGYCAAMGDALAAENKPSEIIRTYYQEALSIKPEEDPDLLKANLRQLVMTFYAKPGELLKTHSLREVLQTALELAATSRRPLLFTLLSVSANSLQIQRDLVNTLASTKAFRLNSLEALKQEFSIEVAQTDRGKRDLFHAWKKAEKVVGRILDEIEGESRYLQKKSVDLSSVSEQIRSLEIIDDQYLSQYLSPTEKKLFSECQDLMNGVQEYVNQKQYLEQERLANKIKEASAKLIMRVEASPTRFTIERLRPYILEVQGAVRKDFAETEQAAEPRTLDVELSVSDYSIRDDRRVDVQLAVYNKPGHSPASRVRIELQQSPTEYDTPASTEFRVTETLGSGDREQITIPVTVTEQARRAKVVTLRMRVSFKTRAGNEIHTDQILRSVQLYARSDFSHIRNPYSPGGPVEDPKMFYGRNNLIQEIKEAIKTAGTRSVVIYGQKRTGKSSILYHLERSLTFPIVPISFSVNDVLVDMEQNANEKKFARFSYEIVRNIHSTLEDLGPRYGIRFDVPRPRFHDMEDSPQAALRDFMEVIKKWSCDRSQLADIRFVLLIDEFTHIYQEISDEALPANFMKAWKGMLERGYFGAVVVGQDLTQEFIERFPNEFQVSQRLRVSYLNSADASQLIEDPIRKDGTDSRYRGDAVDRILDLTAGNPYYIQRFCERLVSYMNAEQKVYAGPADVDAVAERLVASLSEEEFDNLLTPGDTRISRFTSQQVIDTLVACSRGVGNDSFLDVNSPNARTLKWDAAEVIADLERREVIERQSPGRWRIRVGLFNRWLRTTHWLDT